MSSPPREEGPHRRLIIVGATPPPNHGSAAATVHLIEAVTKAGAFAAHLETGDDDRPVFSLGALDPANVYYGFKHLFKLALILRRNPGADVYVPISQNRWGFFRDSLLIRLAALARRDVVVHLHGGGFGDFYASRRGLERRWISGSFRHVTEAWVLTPTLHDIFDGLLPRERVRVLENMSDDVGPPVTEPRSEPRLHVLFLSNLVPEKGHPDLLSALETMAARGSAGVDLRLAGQVAPAEAEEVERRALALRDAGIGVELVGPVSGAEKLAQFRWADVLALPSHYPPEGQPIVLPEAMSAGLAVIGSDHAGIPWTVRDGEEGIIVGKRDIAAIAAAIERLRDDPALLAAMGASGRARYEANYDRSSYDRRVAELLASGSAELNAGQSSSIPSETQKKIPR